MAHHIRLVSLRRGGFGGVMGSSKSTWGKFQCGLGFIGRAGVESHSGTLPAMFNINVRPEVTVKKNQLLMSRLLIL